MSRERNRTDEKQQQPKAKSPLKLKLNKQTLRMLNRDELALVAGGAPKHTYCENEQPC